MPDPFDPQRRRDEPWRPAAPLPAPAGRRERILGAVLWLGLGVFCLVLVFTGFPHPIDAVGLALLATVSGLRIGLSDRGYRSGWPFWLFCVGILVWIWLGT